MREKKYENILDDYPESVTEEIMEELEVIDDNDENNEVKLSMTRELKFKDIIGENVDDNSAEISVIDEISILEELEDIDDKKISDELYLTSSFKPFKKRFRIRKIFKLLFCLMLIFVAGVALTFFVIFPVYEKFISSKPKVIFDKTLTYVGEQLKSINEYNLFSDDVLDMEICFDIETNIEDFKVLNNNKFSVGLGYDPGTNKSETSLFINNEYGYSLLTDENNKYYKYSTSDSYIKGMDIDDIIDYSEIDKIMNHSLSKDDFNYFVDQNINIFKDILTEDMIVAEKDEIDINGKTFSVVKNSLVLNKDNITLIDKLYKEKVLNDDKLLKIEAELFGEEIENLKKKYNAIATYDENYSLNFNIYTIKGNKFVGFDVELNGFRNIYYYVDEKGNFDLHFNFNDIYLMDLDNDIVIDFKGKIEGTNTNVEFFINNEKIGNFKLKSFNYDFVEFDYDLLKYNFNGSVKIDLTKDITVIYSLVRNNEYFNGNVNLKRFFESDIGIINEDNVILYSDKVIKQEKGMFENKIKASGMFEAFECFIKIVDDSDEVIFKTVKDINA